MSALAAIGGKLLGALTGGLGEKIGDVVDQLVTDKDLRQQLKHDLSIKTLITDAELQAIELQADRDVQIAIEETHQAELNQSDLYTKRTRPKIARQSWMLAGAYGIATIFGALVDPFVDANLVTLKFDAYAFGTLAGPALWYSGMRGIDKWKGNG